MEPDRWMETLAGYDTYPHRFSGPVVVHNASTAANISARHTDADSALTDGANPECISFPLKTRKMTNAFSSRTYSPGRPRQKAPGSLPIYISVDM